MPSVMAGNCPSLRLSTPANLSGSRGPGLGRDRRGCAGAESSGRGQLCMGLHSCSFQTQADCRPRKADQAQTILVSRAADAATPKEEVPPSAG